MLSQIQDLLMWVFGGLLTVTGFFLKGAMDRLTAVEDKYNRLHENYVKKDDFKDFRNELWSRLDKLEIKLDGKPDTP